MYLFRKSGQRAIFNPVLIAIVLLVGILLVTGTSYETYFEGAQFVHFLLGPATVALAVPLYRQFDRVRHSGLAIFVALLAGSATAVVSATLITWLLRRAAERRRLDCTQVGDDAHRHGHLRADRRAAVADRRARDPDRHCGLHDRHDACSPASACREGSAQGFALGLASHGIGTARALQVSEVAGAFSALAMGLNGLATSLLVPLLAHLLWQWFWP